MTEAAPTTLADLRAEIDRIDSEMHALLIERSQIIETLISVKKTQASGSAFRPGREADMMKRLALRHKGLLPLDTVESIWRIIIATFTYVQASYSVHADVSGGDPGVFAMAAAVCEAMEAGPQRWRDIGFTVVPGVTAMLAVAARAGAPLGHDFCAISLSDNLKPWAVIERRLKAAAEAGFVIALYNPVSRARPKQLDTAFDILRGVLPAATPVIFGRAAGRPDERIDIRRLAEAGAGMADMATCVIVGSTETRTIDRNGRPPLVYSPRSWGRPAQ